MATLKKTAVTGNGAAPEEVPTAGGEAGQTEQKPEKVAKKREKKSALVVLEILKDEKGKANGQFKLLEHEGKMFDLSEADALILDEKTPVADYAVVRVLKIRKPKLTQSKMFE